jgi:16S rRNA (cytidine1402-2'-O)-methyltransferase
MGVLSVVSTPIGNLGDMTHRAVETLRGADIILAEDTRRTGILLRHYEITGRLVAAHEHNEASRAAQVVAWLGEGKKIALVSDAGTPLLSDPGARIVREAAEAGFPVVPIPGASALLAALVASGIATDRFTFFGFPSRKASERSALLDEVAALSHTAVLYESPQRLGRLLQDLAQRTGADRRVAVARELTKLHEEVFRGTLADATIHYGAGEPRGEIVVVVEGRDARGVPEVDAHDATALAQTLLADGMPPSGVARELREQLGMPRNDAYQLAQQLAAS